MAFGKLEGTMMLDTDSLTRDGTSCAVGYIIDDGNSGVGVKYIKAKEINQKWENGTYQAIATSKDTDNYMGFMAVVSYLGDEGEGKREKGSIAYYTPASIDEIQNGNITYTLNLIHVAYYMTGIYKIADKLIKIDSLYDGIHKMCHAYAADGEPDITVTISPKDIELERENAAKDQDDASAHLALFSDRYLETLAVYRKIAKEMLSFNTFLFHGSAIELDGETYLFTAKSGTGKSTHTRLWRELFGDRAVMINDDKPLIRVDENGATIFGTPWDGKHRLSTNKSSPLKAVCVLERGAENKIFLLTKKEAFPHVLVQRYHPDNGTDMIKTLSLADALCDKVKLCRLECNMDIEAARVSYEGMK